jgi:hypothetical protein
MYHRAYYEVVWVAAKGLLAGLVGDESEGRKPTSKSPCLAE